MNLVKDASIKRLVSALDLESRGWILSDDWDADLFAIGIARKVEPRRLVYVSTFKAAPGGFHYECEVPSGPDDTDYRTSEEGENVTFEELVEVLERHLAGTAQ